MVADLVVVRTELPALLVPGASLWLCRGLVVDADDAVVEARRIDASDFRAGVEVRDFRGDVSDSVEP